MKKVKCRKCLELAEWKGGELHCSKCNQLIAIIYKIGKEAHIYTFPKFKQYRKEIEGREDTKRIAKSGEYLRNISFEEFNSIHYDCRCDQNELLPVQDDWICEDSESEDPERLRQAEDLDNNTY